MASRLSPSDQRSLVVNGYIRNIQRLLSYVIIPNEVIDVCVSFFLPILWDLSALQLKNSVIAKLPGEFGNDWKTALLNHCIRRELCDIFELEITQTKANEDKIKNSFFFGFIKDSIDNFQPLKALSRTPAHIAIKVYQRNIWLYNPSSGGPSRQIVRQISQCFTKDDKFRMVIDFSKGYVRWYLNNDEREIVTAHIAPNTAIYPAFSLFWQTNQYEITDYRFVKK